MENHPFYLALLNLWPSLRMVDLTKETDDPGNTELFIIFLPTDYDEQEGAELEIRKLEYINLNSSGDHHEELTIISQNNELVLIINNNK